MCGIVGIVNFNPRDTVDETVLKRMRDVLRHRGPDGEGLWIDGPVGLGHRRLSIVDVATGQQPMTNEDGSCWITYNGEIYNHASLRPDLVARGHRYSTRSDTETILHLYEEEGERCVERLQGMFAFALWDRGRSRLLLARDRLGIKPLYYAMTDRQLLFASEIKAILAVGRLGPGDLFLWRAKARAGPDADLVPGGRDRGAPLLAASPGARRPGCRARRARPGGPRASWSGRAQPSHERRAARPVPVRRHRLERPCRPHGAHGARAHPHVLSWLHRSRRQ